VSSVRSQGANHATTRGAVIARIALILVFAAGWTDDLWAKSLMDTPAMPLSIDEDVAPLGLTYRLEILKKIEALREPAGLRADETVPPPAASEPNRLPLPPPTLRSTDPLRAWMSLQR
jgi:hypothetical protein